MAMLFGTHLIEGLCACGCQGERTPLNRSYALLVAHLRPAERASFQLAGIFEVTGSRGGRYQIHVGRSGNVCRIDSPYPWMPAYRLCAAPDNVPVFDVMLAQKLLIETDETAFLAVAHILSL